MREVLARLAALGKVRWPKVSDVERVVGRPLFVDVDSFRESTRYLARPPLQGPPEPFLYVEVVRGPSAGKSARLCAHDPITFGRFARNRLVLADGHREAGTIRFAENGGVELAIREGADLVTVRGAHRTGIVPLAVGDEVTCGDEVLVLRQHPGWSGPFTDDVDWLSATLEWDVHHSRPHEARDASVEQVTFVLRVPLAEVESALAPDFGPARALAEGELAMHPFYVRPAAGGTAVEWLGEVPDRALERMDPTSRERMLRAVFAAAAEATTLQEIDAIVAHHRAGAGVFEHGVEVHGVSANHVTWYRASIRLRPPMNARALAALAHWDGASAAAHDVHMTSWKIERNGRPPRVGKWVVEASLTGWPKHEGKAAESYDLESCVAEVEWLVFRETMPHD